VTTTCNPESERKTKKKNVIGDRVNIDRVKVFENKLRAKLDIGERYSGGWITIKVMYASGKVTELAKRVLSTHDRVRGPRGMGMITTRHKNNKYAPSDEDSGCDSDEDSDYDSSDEDSDSSSDGDSDSDDEFVVYDGDSEEEIVDASDVERVCTDNEYDYSSNLDSDSEERLAKRKNVKKLYHVTDFECGRSILRNGFQPGKSGYLGPGCYFAESEYNAGR
jgi:hypothetical protein